MAKAPVLILMLGILFGPVQASAQVGSKTAAVTLIARVQESFALIPVPMPASNRGTEQPASNPQGVQVVLNWRLRYGRSFQVEYKLSDESGGQARTLYSGVVIPSEVLATPPILSFLPSRVTHPRPVGMWGNKETDPSGAAGLFMVIPANRWIPTPTLRLRAIIL